MLFTYSTDFLDFIDLNLFQWLSLMTLAVLYNLVVVIGRAVFWELENLLPVGWYLLDYTCDALYLADMFIRMHEGNN